MLAVAPLAAVLQAILPDVPAPLLATELAATLLQGAITTGLAALCVHLFARYRRPWFGWFAMAWGVYVARLLCILSFLLTNERIWLYWHQVTTGWTALVLLWAAMVFWRQPATRPVYMLFALFPPLWSYIAIYQLDHFLWAALPAVLFLSGATMWTGWVFWRHHQMVASPGARLLSVSFFAWGLHHLDYPFLRAQGAWTPWGYYLDILFELLVGAGLVLLVLDDLGRGVRALSTLSGDLQRREANVEPMELLLSRPLTLPGVRGTAMFMFDADASSGRFVRGAGSCGDWQDTAPQATLAGALARMRLTRRPQVIASSGAFPFVAALPITAANRLVGALVMAGDVRNPFTALDDDFLLALGQQVGAALEQFELDRELAERTRALEHLSARMVRQHEDERRRLSRELHDETAQVFSAVKMQLEALRSNVVPSAAPRVDRLSQLVDQGIASIRQVTSDLRPSLLDDLGLLPALRSLVTDFVDRSGLHVTLIAPTQLPPLPPDADLAVFRALQEALSNVARHAAGSSVVVEVAPRGQELTVIVRDTGKGFPLGRDGKMREPDGRMGLTGMRERLHAVGGSVEVGNSATGAEVTLRVPIEVTALV
ncbi:MAG: GAF domain-containing sensor histidine kinase [Gemmatimonadaceae bacterium]|nr:GAF domain-containing sensor histidine kinase [Gemmatimonadaceae bacterium]